LRGSTTIDDSFSGTANWGANADQAATNRGVRRKRKVNGAARSSSRGAATFSRKEQKTAGNSQKPERA